MHTLKISRLVLNHVIWLKCSLKEVHLCGGMEGQGMIASLKGLI